MDQVANMCWKP